jgi:hypothetical protein
VGLQPSIPTTPQTSRNCTKIGPAFAKRWVKHHPEYIYKKQKPLSAARNHVRRADVIEHFKKLEAAIQQWGIAPEDIANYDETGFSVGVSGTQWVVTTARNRKKTLYQADPDNRQHLTSVECILVSGEVLPPFIIVTGANVLESDLPAELPDYYWIGCSETGYMNDDLIYDWIQLYDTYTWQRRKGKWRMLISDGFGSHLTDDVVQYCWDNFIIPFCLPAHSTHYTQPLDVTCFQPLKKHHRNVVDTAVRAGDTKFNRREFLAAFDGIRKQTFTPTIIRHAFRDCGIWPLNAELVLAGMPEDDIEEVTPLGAAAAAVDDKEVDLQVTPKTIKQMSVFARQLEEKLLENEATGVSSLSFMKFAKAALTRAHSGELCEQQLTGVLEKVSGRAKRARLSGKHVSKTGIITVARGRRELSERFANDARPRQPGKAVRERWKRTLNRIRSVHRCWEKGWMTRFGEIIVDSDGDVV